jgi:osmotically-inducible protein OsmY
MKGSLEMAIRKFIEEIGEKILPARRHSLPVAGQQQQQGSQQAAGQLGSPPRHYIGGVSVEESAQAIRRYLQTRREFDAPSDLVVLFNEMDAVVILGGTVRDEATREAVIQAAGNIHGVERVDDRMVPAPRPAWQRA